MSTATHALQFYKDGLDANAVPTPALAPRHRFVFVARGTATVDGRTLERENAAYACCEMVVRAGPEGAELWRWELVRVSEQPLLAHGDGVRSRHIVTREIDSIGLGARDKWLFRCDGIEMARDGVAPLHVHPGPGLRCMIEGGLTVDDDGKIEEHREGDCWYETNVQPITARSTGAVGTRFVRVMILAPEFEGYRTAQFIDPADLKKVQAKGGGRWVQYIDKIITL
ncbi:MAG: hypothetical protein O7G83_12205 [Proteobacteria bacterium]|nr:hypothetical protein [Pseudomonadota bacterium]